jgi:hypothetical protein
MLEHNLSCHQVMFYIWLKLKTIHFKRKQAGDPSAPSAVIRCQFCYWSDYVTHVISCLFVSFYVIKCHSLSVISCHIMLFHFASCLILHLFNKVGCGQGRRGKGQICLPKPLATASLSGQRQKYKLLRARETVVSDFGKCKHLIDWG